MSISSRLLPSSAADSDGAACLPARYGCRLCAGLASIAALAPPSLAEEAPAQPARRRFGRAVAATGLAAALPAWAREGVDVGSRSGFTKLVPAEDLEKAAAQQYAQMMREAQGKKALAPDDHPQVRRLRAISQRIIPNSTSWNPRASKWKWEVNLLGSTQINAFCMPGGKIAFYSGILSQLQLEDAEVATIMGHEVAHALREHARERIGKGSATSIGLSLGAQLLGLGQLGDIAANLGTQLLSLKFSRDDETEADLVGMELAARSGYDPAAGVSLWQKMAKVSGSASSADFLSTHPSSSNRIAIIEQNLPKVDGLYAKAPKPDQRFAPMEATARKPGTPSADAAR